MSSIAGTAYVLIKPLTQTFGRDLSRGVSAQSAKAGKDAGKSFGGGFRKSSALAIGAGLGGGLILGATLKRLGEESVRAAASQSAANALIAQSVKKAGAEMTLFGQTIEQVLESESRITGIADEELAPAFTRIVRVTKDSAEAFRLLQLAEDVSRQRQIGVAQTALSLAKARGGQITALRRIIPGLQAENKELSKQENIQRTLAQVQRQFGGARTSFAESDAGQLQRFNVAVNELKETLGAQLLPVLSRVAKSLSDTFAKPETQDKVKQTTSVIGGLLSGLGKLTKAGAEGIGDTLLFKEARAGADNIGRLADSVLSLKERLEGLTKTQQERTKEFIKFNQITELENLRGRRFEERAAPTATTAPAAQPRTRATGFDIERLRKERTKSTADELALFRDRETQLSRQIDILEASGIRGKHDRERLKRLYGELSGITSDISSIEQSAADTRAAAAEEQKRIAEEKKAKAQEERLAALQDAKDAKERARSLREARLQLAVQKSELSKSTKDDKSSRRNLIEFYDQEAKGFRKTRAFLLAVDAEGRKTATQLELKGLGKGTKPATAATSATRTDFFKEAASNFQQFGSNIASRTGILSGQDARGALAGIALQRRSDSQAAFQQVFTQQLQEANVTNDILRSIRDVLKGVGQGTGTAAKKSSNAAETARRLAIMGGPT